MPSIGADTNYSLPPTPRFFSTMALNYDFEINAPKPEAWLNFLREVWPEKELKQEKDASQETLDHETPDQESEREKGDPKENIATLQEWMGYLLTPDTRQQKMLMMIGPPASGRSTIARIITEMVGPDNVASPDLASFAERFGLSHLLGKTVAIVPDARLSGRPDNAQVLGRLLAIAGEDKQQVDRKYRDPVDAKLKVRLILISNDLPKLPDASAALIRRVLLLRFTRTFAEKKDPTLTERLLKELPGILCWAIEGWKRLEKRGHFQQPQTGKELIDQLEEITSPVKAFIKECCEVGPECRVPCQDLYDAYREWAKDNGKQIPADSATFGRDLRACLPDIKKTHPRIGGKKVRCYVGIELKKELAAEFEKARAFEASCRHR
jgi:putative DNA primase/helicase